MDRLLRDSEGRELLLSGGVELSDDVLSVEGRPLFLLEEPDNIPPWLLDAIALGARRMRRPEDDAFAGTTAGIAPARGDQPQ